MGLATLTVVVPVHNEEDNVEIFYDRLRPVLAELEIDDWQILFTNNASTDATLDKILALRRAEPRIKVLTLSRNFGYHISVMAGLSTLESDLYSIIDVDCEDPPELLTTFHREIQAGAHTAYGIRSQRDEPGWMTSLRGLFYWVNHRIADFPVPLWMSEFVMMTRTVRDAVLANRSASPFVRSAIAYVGLKTVGVPYQRSSRRHGVSHQSVAWLLEFAVRGFVASSTFPLRATAYLSGLSALTFAALVLGCGLGLAGASQLAMLIAFAYLLVAIPVFGLYLASAYENTLNRPLYCVDPDKTFL